MLMFFREPQLMLWFNSPKIIMQVSGVFSCCTTLVVGNPTFTKAKYFKRLIMAGAKI